MSKKSLVLASVMLAVFSLVTLAFVVPRIYGTTIVKSKSNICNNRTITPVALPIVICTSCAIQSAPGKPEEGYLILMDSENGKVFAYSDAALLGKEPPKYVSTFGGVGQTFFIEK